MVEPDAIAETAAWYRRVAGEVDGLYADWAGGVAADAGLAELIATLPRLQRQPQLFFAVTRLVGAPELAFPEWREWVLTHWSLVASASVGRTTQTNEPARCAALLPALGLLDGPLALLEVGASAGLCLYPDRYSYRYSQPAIPAWIGASRPPQRRNSVDPRAVARLDPADGVAAVVLEATVDGGMPVPKRMPDIRWRAGIDLAPLDVTSQADLAWLDVLVPPEESERRDRARAAAAIAASDPPQLVAGDAIDALPGLADQAPADATLVVLTVGTLVYLPFAKRQRFADAVHATGARWLSLERAGLVALAPAAPSDSFVLGLDGTALATVSPHGDHITWL